MIVYISSIKTPKCGQGEMWGCALWITDGEEVGTEKGEGASIGILKSVVVLHRRC